jgi:hypothetical protein
MADDSFPAPTVVEDARSELRRLRERLGLAAGGVLVVGLFAQSLGAPLVLPAMGVGLVVMAALYFLPPTKRAWEARRVLAQWNERGAERSMQGPIDGRGGRVPAADAMCRRIAEHTGEHSRSSKVAEELLQTIYDALEDLDVIGLLRSARAKDRDGESLRSRASSLEVQVERRMDDALHAIAEIYEAVLAQDDETLRVVLGRMDEELHQLRAQAEVDSLIRGQPDDRD